MKLIIEIDKKCYESVRYYDGDIMNEWDDHIGCAIFNATPFDTLIKDIKTEIEQAYCKVTNDYDHGRNYGLYIATQIIDKYKAESEDKG